jgi:hypothetical protein
VRDFLEAFEKLRKSTFRFVRLFNCPSVRPVRIEQLGSHSTDFHEIWYLCTFSKHLEKIQVSLKYDNNGSQFTRSSPCFALPSTACHTIFARTQTHKLKASLSPSESQLTPVRFVCWRRATDVSWCGVYGTDWPSEKCTDWPRQKCTDWPSQKCTSTVERVCVRETERYTEGEGQGER